MTEGTEPGSGLLRQGCWLKGWRSHWRRLVKMKVLKTIQKLEYSNIYKQQYEVHLVECQG